MGYIWQHKQWPNFTWDSEAVERDGYAYATEASNLAGEIKYLSEDKKTDTLIDLMVSEAVIH